MLKERPVLSERPLLEDRQLQILRLIGKGNSRTRIAEALSIPRYVITEDLAIACRKLGVDGQTPAVIQALEKRLIEIDEVIDLDFNWDFFYDLNKTQRQILDVFVSSKDEQLTDEQIATLDLPTSREPRKYVSSSLAKISSRLGLAGKTETLVHYYVFKQLVKRGELKDPSERESSIGQNKVSPLTPKESNILRNYAVWISQGKNLDPSVRAASLNMKPPTLEKILGGIYRKLGVNSIDEAFIKAAEMRILR